MRNTLWKATTQAIPETVTMKELFILVFGDLNIKIPRDRNGEFSQQTVFTRDTRIL